MPSAWHPGGIFHPCVGGAGYRVILELRGGFLKRPQEPVVTPPPMCPRSQPDATVMEAKSCLVS